MFLPLKISRKKIGLAGYQPDFMLFEPPKNSAKIQLSTVFFTLIAVDVCQYFT